MRAWEFSMVEHCCQTALSRIDRSQTPDLRVWKRDEQNRKRERGATYLRPRLANVLPVR